MGKLTRLWGRVPHKPEPIKREIGEEGTVVQPITDELSGQITVNGSYWSAVAPKNTCLLPGCIVYIVRRNGLTLHVIPKNRR